MSVQVTDHALVRYLERCCGMDVERLRGEVAALVSPRAEAAAIAVGEAHIRLGNNLVLRVVSEPKGLTVVTIFPSYRGVDDDAPRPSPKIGRRAA